MIQIKFKEIDEEGDEWPQEWSYENDQIEMANEIFDVLVSMCQRPGNKRRNSTVSVTLWKDGKNWRCYERGRQGNTAHV